MNYFIISCVVYILNSIFSKDITGAILIIFFSSQMYSRDRLINLEYLIFTAVMENYRILL